ncbi:acyl-CoA dehydrogenase family protein [Gordonia sp. ABSL1-1]|uniref:acyl-CoA dehydrogenase family protein n=1 Tax=Gordonia sp. ABSL1-1 TaxID=3053923 RepID=UPI0025729C79|nr:acyl-CoA dehydrogenase family protein [Gordonia sp. ABSL1-1]MDL9936206.1 acyl-CoA dehydrogenase family protein [Gordonia sp. ABSL1-1]
MIHPTDLTDDLRATLTSMIDRIGIDTATPPAGTDDHLWDLLVEAGFTALDCPADCGGGGATTADALTVLSALAGAGAITPMLEHGVLATWLAGQTGFSLVGRTATVAVADTGWSVGRVGDEVVLTGTASEVTRHPRTDTVVVLAPASAPVRPAAVAVIALDAAGLAYTAGTDLSGVPVGTLTMATAPVVSYAENGPTTTEFLVRAALAESVVLAAGARAVCDQTVAYASTREQFGRPLAGFQAIAHRLAELAELTALMETAVATATHPDADPTTIVATKTVCSMYAHDVAAAAHQIHGAIGFTGEHRLGRFTTALWTHRDRHGSDRAWARTLGDRILAGADVWELVTART